MRAVCFARSRFSSSRCLSASTLCLSALSLILCLKPVSVIELLAINLKDRNGQ